MIEKQHALRGCLLGLAVGDAMGYAVDRKTLAEICEDYGPNGLLGYDLVNGYADVTSYTQLAAFTANGLLFGITRGQLRGIMAPPVRYIELALREWSRSQQYSDPQKNYCWLSTVPEMKRRHCMDNWMLGTLTKEALGTMEEPINNSSHPATLTEAIPIAMLSADLNLEQPERNRLCAEAVALTHSSPDAFLSAAALTEAMSRILTQEEIDPETLAKETLDAIQFQFGREYHQTAKLWELYQLAVTLSQSDASPMEAMELLRCQTAPEVLAGVLYACITCRGDFDTALITAVNHSGRSAAVGAITGAILGARMGEQALPEFYLESLEPTPYLLELADDLSNGCPMVADSNLFDDDWDRKYIHAGL